MISVVRMVEVISVAKLSWVVEVIGVARVSC